MRRWIVLAIAVSSIACLMEGIATPEVQVVESTTTITTPYSIPACQPAADVTYKLQKISDTFVEVIASGLQPGETPYVYYNTPVGNIPGKGGAYSGDIVNEDGEFFFALENLEPPEGKTSATWDIRLVHEGGVECTTITLP